MPNSLDRIQDCLSTILLLLCLFHIRLGLVLILLLVLLLLHHKLVERLLVLLVSEDLVGATLVGCGRLVLVVFLKCFLSCQSRSKSVSR